MGGVFKVKNSETVPRRGKASAFPGGLRGPQRRTQIDASRQRQGPGGPVALAGAGRGGTTGSWGGSVATKVAT